MCNGVREGGVPTDVLLALLTSPGLGLNNHRKILKDVIL